MNQVLEDALLGLKSNPSPRVVRSAARPTPEPAKVLLRPPAATVPDGGTSVNWWQRCGTRATRVKLLRALFATAHLLRRTVGIATLAFPGFYFAYVFVAAGIVRKEIFASPWLTRVIEVMLVPAVLLNEKIFAVPLMYHRVDMVLVGLGVLAVVLREVILAPLRKAESWAEEKLSAPKPQMRPRPRVQPASALCRS